MCVKQGFYRLFISYFSIFIYILCDSSLGLQYFLRRTSQFSLIAKAREEILYIRAGPRFELGTVRRNKQSSHPPAHFRFLSRRWSVMVYVKSKPWANPACVLFSISCFISCCEISNVWFGYILMGGSLPPPPPGEVIRCPPLPQYNVLSSIKIGPKDGLNGCVLCVKCHIFFIKKTSNNKSVFLWHENCYLRKERSMANTVIIQAVFHLLTTWGFLRTLAAVIFFLLVKTEIGCSYAIRYLKYKIFACLTQFCVISQPLKTGNFVWTLAGSKPLPLNSTIAWRNSSLFI